MISWQRLPVRNLTISEFRNRIRGFVDPNTFTRTTPSRWVGFLEEILSIPDKKRRRGMIHELKMVLQSILINNMGSELDVDAGIVSRFYRLLPPDQFRDLYQEVLQKTRPRHLQQQEKKSTTWLSTILSRLIPTPKGDMDSKFQKNLVQYVKKFRDQQQKLPPAHE